MPANVKRESKSGTAIAAAQNRPKLYTVLSPFGNYAEGEKIFERADVVGYYGGLAEAQLSKDDKPLALTESEILDCVKKIDGDGEDEENDRVESILDAHRKKHPYSVAIVQTNATIEALAIKLAKVAGAAIDGGWKAFEEVTYKAVELAHLFKTNMTPEELSAIPPVKSKAPKDDKGNTNARYNILHRTRVASDRGVPTYIGDIYDRMPDAGNITLGKSLMKEIETLDPENKGVKEIKKRDQVKGTKLARLLKKRNNSVKNATEAFHVIERMAEINEFDLVSIEFKMDDEDHTKTDLQNLTPLKIISYKTKADKKAGKMNSFGLIGKSDILTLTMLPTLNRETATMAKVLEAKTPRTSELEGYKKGEELFLQMRRMGMWLSPDVGTREGRRADFTLAIQRKDTDGIPVEQDLIRNAHYVAEWLAPFRQELDQLINLVDVKTKERDTKRKEQAKEQDAKAQEALKNGHKTAA